MTGAAGDCCVEGEGELLTVMPGNAGGAKGLDALDQFGGTALAL